MDIAGPKIRTGAVAGADEARLERGDCIRLVRRLEHHPREPQATCEPESIIDALSEGAEIAYDDGKLAGFVEASDDTGALIRITRAASKGVKLKPEKGLNLPGTRLNLSALTDKDRADLGFVARHADMIGYSFVQSGDDVR